MTGKRGWGGGGAKSYDGEKAWSSTNHSKYSLIDDLTFNFNLYILFVLGREGDITSKELM